MNLFQETSIIGASVDELVIAGIQHVQKYGERLEGARAGNALQAYDVTYVLTDSRNRVHNLRAPASVKYFANELVLYFIGTHRAIEMARASKKWLKLQNPDGTINSNYGRYIFHDDITFHKTPPRENPQFKVSQYDWCVNLLAAKPQTRRAIININNMGHKASDPLDMPCTIAIEFIVINSHLCARIHARSIDVITGLPYDIAFFSFVTELMWRDLQDRGLINLKLGNTVLKTTFTQIYDETTHLADEALENSKSNYPKKFMPHIKSAREVLKDIYKGTTDSETMQWCHEQIN